MNECWHFCPTCRQDWAHTGGRGPQSCPFRKDCKECAQLKPKQSIKGVQRESAPRLKSERWRASLYRGGKKIHLGSFDTKEEAALAYQKAVTDYQEETKDGARYTEGPERVSDEQCTSVRDARLRQPGPAQDTGAMVL